MLSGKEKDLGSHSEHLGVEEDSRVDGRQDCGEKWLEEKSRLRGDGGQTEARVGASFCKTKSC